MALAKHGTLTPNTVATVTLSRDVGQVEVTNRNGAGEIYFTVDDTDPTIGGDNTWVLPAAVCGRVARSASGNTTVRLISAVAATYSVTSL